MIDLLNPNMRRYLQVRWSKNKGFYVENLFVVECESDDDLMAVLEEGRSMYDTVSLCLASQVFSLESAMGHSPKLVPDVRVCCPAWKVCPRRFSEAHTVCNSIFVL